MARWHLATWHSPGRPITTIIINQNNHNQNNIIIINLFTLIKYWINSLYFIKLSYKSMIWKMENLRRNDIQFNCLSNSRGNCKEQMGSRVCRLRYPLADVPVWCRRRQFIMQRVTQDTAVCNLPALPNDKRDVAFPFLHTSPSSSFLFSFSPFLLFSFSPFPNFPIATGRNDNF